ncbi:MAG: bifunctional precorrin-2 dehydrogenase/sirohydrochlorin ferrochelatase [Aquificaceae bacterium]|nr:bifunctional precorrin-2 dehydrogenase/sirohydrochlorin ferrochelatase [Aquificaceae bacterium]MDW8423912.1 bifunctional precorrin-2 dehydrogenase/sirohydrochlorin ferrochelatase [Aquificaceae bacterium]
MPYFPLFVELKDRRVVVVGGGSVASRKVEKLLPFGPLIKVVAPKVTDYIQRLAEEGRLELIKRKFRMGDLKDAHMVIVAVDNIRLQERIYKHCIKRGIHCNAVDSPKLCTFLFPSLIVKGELVIGISTSGKAPALSAGLRQYIESRLPEDIQELLSLLEDLRNAMPEGEERRKKLSLIVKDKLGL